MTINTEHGLVCLDDNDYAAIALAIQTDALAVDGALSEISTALDNGYLNPYWMMATTSTAGPFSTTSVEIPIPGFSVAATNQSTSTTSAPGGRRITVPRSGWYGHGGYANMVASGAVTALSDRSLFARVTLQEPGLSTVVSNVPWRTVETSTGGEFLVSYGGAFHVLAGQTIDVELYFSHGNLASGINIVAPARIWCHFLASGVEIGSA